VRFRAVSAAKKGVKLALLGPAAARRERRPGLLVLIYHRVGAGMGQEMDLPAALFERQLRFLRKEAPLEVVALAEGLSRAEAGGLDRDLVAVTFDDGYRDVYTRAWPVLRELAVPATLFLATAFLERESPAPIRPGAEGLGDPPEPLTWDQAGEMAASGLVEVGSHSHTHRDFDGLSAPQAREECERSDDVIARRLGVEVGSFAYPRAVVAHEDVVRARYRLAVGGDGGKNVPGELRPHRLARVPVRASDGMFFFRRRVGGAAPLEDRLYDRLRGRAARG
jgi:peptidoglycan/xylan/chitin deacetylase (PgdA/CDA1 family)